MPRTRIGWIIVVGLVLVLPSLAIEANAQEPAKKAALSEYFPPPEDKGGWRTLLPESGTPDALQKTAIRERIGIDWDKLQEAWQWNAAADGSTGLLVIRKGFIVGEWYKDADRSTAFNIYSSSKSYTSTAFGMILSDFGNGPLPNGKSLTLDTKVCNAEWLPQSLPLPDPLKADITVRNLLNMTSGIGPDPVPSVKPYEWSLGTLEGSPNAKLKGAPGSIFQYSNGNVSHLVLLFNQATGSDLFPFLDRRLFEPIGLNQVRWMTIGGETVPNMVAIGPYSQGYSGIHTNPREHARFCYLALHKGEWAGRRIVPASYYDFAWTGTKVKPDYGGQWWVYPHVAGAPRDLVMTLGRNHNDGFVSPELDLVFVRLGNGSKFAKDFEKELVLRVLAAVEK